MQQYNYAPAYLRSITKLKDKLITRIKCKKNEAFKVLMYHLMH
jgi:hypothetical protein